MAPLATPLEPPLCTLVIYKIIEVVNVHRKKMFSLDKSVSWFSFGPKTAIAEMLHFYDDAK